MSWMSEWVAKASMDKTAKSTYMALSRIRKDRTLTRQPAYTISMYQPSNSKKKFKYTQSGNAMGKTCGTDDVPSRLREMLRQPVDGEVKSLWVSGADVAMALLHEATGGERGAEIAKALLHEAAGEEGGAAPRKEGRCQSSLPVDTY